MPVTSRELPSRVPPRQFGPRGSQFEQLETIPELGLMSVPHGSITGRLGWVFTADGKLLSDCVWPYRVTGPKVLPNTFPKARRLRGVCLNIASDWGCTNYAHFVTDSLSRYRLFTMSGMDPDSIDYIYAPKPDSALTMGLMEALGIPMEKCIWAWDEPRVQADTVIATSFPGARHNYARWLVNFLRTARPATAKGGKRIFVPRGKVRNLSNEQEILSIVRSFGFEIYDCKKFAGHEYFGDADIVVGPHGAGLANLAFCKPGTRVLELLPSDHSYPFYYTLAESGDLDYSFIMGRSAQDRPFGSGISPFDFWIDPEVLRATLTTLTDEVSQEEANRRSSAPGLNFLDKLPPHRDHLGLGALGFPGDPPKEPGDADIGQAAGEP